MEDLFDEIFNEEDNEEIIDEKNGVGFLGSYFCIVFQNFIHFLRLIKKKFRNCSFNVKLLLKNNLEYLKLGDEYKSLKLKELKDENSNKRLIIEVSELKKEISKKNKEITKIKEKIEKFEKRLNLLN